MKTKSLHSKYIGIDPGKSGGIVCLDNDSIVAKKCPDNVIDMAMTFSIMVGDTPPKDVVVMLEKVWAMPMDGRSSIFKFGTNFGQWEGIIATYEIEPQYVVPKKWMKYFDCPPKLKKQDRKNWLKDLARVLYPDLPKVTLSTADAILIAHYSKQIDKT